MTRKISVAWGGQEYSIPETRIFEVGEEIEDIITLPELMLMQATPKYHKLARCYAVLLNAAGATVTPEAVYGALMASLGDPEKPEATVLSGVLSGLFDLLLDGMPLVDEEPEADDEAKKPNP